MGRDVNLQKELLGFFHCSATGGHSSRDATMKRLAFVLYWKGTKKDVQQFIRECDTCQRCKYENAASTGLLQPLPIPESVWSDISMDFIEGLPNSGGKNSILVVIDKLSEYAHFLALSHPYTALNIAQAFLDNIYKLHGVPTSIVTDRDKVFLSVFWKELFKLLKIELKFSTAYHPQIDR